MVKRIYIREEYCMGCRLCEVHCLVQHSKSKDIIKVYKGKEPKPVPGIIVEEKDYQVLQRFDAEKNTYKKIVLKNNRIVGAILVGNIERAGIYTGLIKDNVDTASFREQLLGKNFGLISLPEEYRKHLVTVDGGVF